RRTLARTPRGFAHTVFRMIGFASDIHKIHLPLKLPPWSGNQKLRKFTYTHKGRSKSEFVKKEDLADVKKQLKNYRQFKKLTAEWVDLSLELARLRKSVEKG
ncbi:MAG: DUF6788 family protein, partial [bacterium]